MKQARWAVNTIFFVNGFVHANYYARLPRIQDLFDLDNSALGFVLLASSTGALLSMPVAGWLISRQGSRKLTLAAAFLFCLCTPLIPLAPWAAGLGFVFFLLGASSGILDVSMNAQAVLVEQRYQRPVMTSFHALFSLGMMAGAGTGSLFSWWEAPLWLHLAAVATAGALLLFLVRGYLITDAPLDQPVGPAFRLPNTAMVSIGVIAFCSMVGEGAMVDWSTNFLEKSIGTPAALAPLGMAAFAVSMTMGRLLGDRARSIWGDTALMRACGLVASLGMVLLLTSYSTVPALLGFLLAGIGLSAVVPIAYSIGGTAPGLPPGVGLSMVTTVGYTGFLFGPPVIGFIADLSSLRSALWLVFALFVIMVLLATFYRPRS